jgi:hypothetical protein
MNRLSANAINTEISYRSVVAVSSTIEAVLSFKALSAGWHYGKGVAFSRRVIELALFVNSRLTQIGSVPTEAFPLVTGNVLIVGYNGDDEVEVTCCADGSFEVTQVVGGEVEPSNSFSGLDELYVFLGNIIWKSKKSSGLSIQDITAITKKDFQVLPSAGRQTALAHQSLQLSVPFHVVQRNAIISEDTIHQQLPASHPFFYACTSLNFRTIPN